ncbi:hypothetical protein Ahy_A06g026713 isoform D [Arachis hypogaea]|uniref:Uncharacterized protein n=1 Tax=Arachis hypogaea TaxID=3818 RepID=A0A445CLG7_ARAHY|nr:hypothetical protein Ahy_A06g026713 isoform D [Arachis hypogaea]
MQVHDQLTASLFVDNLNNLERKKGLWVERPNNIYLKYCTFFVYLVNLPSQLKDTKIYDWVHFQSIHQSSVPISPLPPMPCEQVIYDGKIPFGFEVNPEKIEDS